MIITIFGTWNPEEISHKWSCICPPLLKNVTTLPREMQNSLYYYCYNLQPFYGPLSETTQKKHSPTHTYPDHQPVFINFLHRLQSIASSQFNLRVWQSFCPTSLQVIFGLPLDLAPSTSYSTHFFTQSLSSFRNTCPYHHNLFYCSTENMSSNLSQLFYLELLSFTLMSHIHLTILISARWCVMSFSFLTGQILLPCNTLLCTQLLYSLPLIINDISLLASSGTNCLNIPIQILASTAA